MPLSAAFESLEQARVLSKDHELIFPDSDSRPRHVREPLPRRRDGLGYPKDKCTPHGFPSSFRDWAAEETKLPQRSGRDGACASDP